MFTRKQFFGALFGVLAAVAALLAQPTAVKVPDERRPWMGQEPLCAAPERSVHEPSVVRYHHYFIDGVEVMPCEKLIESRHP